MWQYPSDDAALKIESQFLLGDFMMAAPVTNPGNTITNTTALRVFFPSGSVYYDFYSFTRYVAGNYYFDIPFDNVVPLYVREGKVVHF